MTVHTIFLIGGEEDESARFVEDAEGDRCALNCEYRGRTVTESANDFFEALCKIRLVLEREGLIPFCYGSSLNVYPSGMARSMALGKAAYRMQSGRHVYGEDLVNIFAAGPDIVPATVARQREFFVDWVSSRRT